MVQQNISWSLFYFSKILNISFWYRTLFSATLPCCAPQFLKRLTALDTLSMPGTKGNVKFCYVCAKDVGNGTNLNMHMEKHADHLRFSNLTSDYNKTACKICGKKFVLGVMRNHTQKLHQMTITEYKDKFQQHFFTLEDPIFHRCGVCQVILLLDSDSIARHLKNKTTHGMTHKEYNQKFINLAYNTQPKENMKYKGNKKSEPRELNSESANVLSAKITDNLFKTKEIQNQTTSSRKTNLVRPKSDEEKSIPSLGGTMPDGTEHIEMDDGTFDIASFREFLRFLGSGEEGPNTSYPTIETILMMDTSSS